MLQLVLASRSPRRRLLLQEKGFLFQTFSIEVSEILNKNLSVERAVEELAKQKAQALVESGQLPLDQSYLVLAADTIVYLNGQVLGKPKDQQEALYLLGLLSGNSHQVITGFCLWNTSENRYVLGHDVCKVKFKTLTEQEIQDYVASGDPMDKAGAYGIQTVGEKFVETFEGSIKTIIGLPIDHIEKVMTEESWHVKRS